MFKKMCMALLCLMIPVVAQALSLVGVELLYFKPSIDQSSYVISSTLNQAESEFVPSGTRHINASNYKPAFRITASTSLCRAWNDLELRFTHLCANQSDSTSGPRLFDTIGYPGAQEPEGKSYNGTARIRDTYRYSGADLTFGRFPISTCFENLEILAGLHAAYILHRTKAASDGTYQETFDPLLQNRYKLQSQFWGIGPQLGMNYLYDNLFCPNLALTGSVRGALLCSNTNANLHYRSLTELGIFNVVNLKNQDLWRVTPTFDARLGVFYQFECGCFDTSVEVGYEWIWYNNAVDSIRGVDVVFPGDTIDVYSDFSMQGPYFRICVGF